MRKIDSISAGLGNLQHDSDRVDALSALCYYHYTVDPDRGLSYGEKALSLAQSIHWLKGIAHAYGNLASCYYSKGQYSKATEHWLLSLRTLQDAGLPTSETIANIGNVYLDLGDYERALDYYRRAEKQYRSLDKRLQSTDRTIFYLEAIGTALLSLHRNAEAKEYFEALLEAATDVPEYYKGVSYASCAVLSVRDKQYKLAERYTEAALEALHTSDDKIARAISYLLLSEVILDQSIAGFTTINAAPSALGPYATHNAIRLSSMFCDSAISISTALHNGGILQHAFRLRARMEEQRGNLLGALRAIHSAQVIEDSLFSARQSQQIAELNFKHVDEQREALSKIERERTDLIRNGLLSGIAIVLVSLAVVLMQQRRIKREKSNADAVLHNILPREIATRLKAGESSIANRHTAVSILFADIVEFTSISASMSAEELVMDLNQLFSAFDDATERNGCEKIKTVGDAYMVVSGAPQVQHDHAERIANLACDMLKAVSENKAKHILPPLTIRIGIHCGEVVAGVIGKKKFAYDLWGDAVNTASRMESSGEPGRIHCSHEFVQQLQSGVTDVKQRRFVVSERGTFAIKGKGSMRTYFIDPL